MSRKFAGNFALLLLLRLVLGAPLYAGEKGWSLREIPPLDPPGETPASAAEAREIKALIRSLAQVNAPDIGFSSTMEGDAFPPVPGVDYWGGWTSAPHNLKRAKSLTKLVAFGPKALPFLLDSLTDKTPTKLTLELPHYSSGRGSMKGKALSRIVTLVCLQVPGFMDPGREIPSNPMNREEARIFKKAKVPQQADGSSRLGIVSSGELKADFIKDYKYRVTVGDLCFVAIGQITNRTYRAARYQPTGGVIVNSAAHDAKIAEVVRSVWAGKDPRRRLFESLLIDFHTRGGDQRGGSERLQIGAAIRLLYYFPKEAGPVVARRLRGLEVTEEQDPDSREGFERNGIWADELLKAVTFSSHPQIRRELLGIFRRTIDSEIALAALPGIPKKYNAEVLAKLRLFLKALPQEEEDWHGQGYHLLEAVGTRFPDRAAALIRGYVKGGSSQRRTTLCRVLREKWAGALALDFLPSLLRDKAEAFGETYSVKPGQYKPLLPRRICDEAALTLTRHLKGVSFKLEGTHANLDRQIQAILKKLAEKKKAQPLG
jgi:hypothetical protein